MSEGLAKLRLPGTVNENVLESDFVPLCDVAHSQISDFWRGCRFSLVSGSRSRARKIASPTSWGYCVFHSGDQNISGYLKYSAPVGP